MGEASNLRIKLYLRLLNSKLLVKFPVRSFYNYKDLCVQTGRKTEKTESNSVLLTALDCMHVVEPVKSNILNRIVFVESLRSQYFTQNPLQD